jgi:hypothetical protein
MSRIRVTTQSLVALPVTLALAVALPASASADVGKKIIERCGHGESLAGYTVKQYKRALQEMETEVIEYTDCAEKIEEAELAAAGRPQSGAGGNGGGTGRPGAPTSGPASGNPAGYGNQAIPTTPAEQRQLARAAQSKPEPIRLGGQDVRPGVVHADIAGATSNLPKPLLAMIAAIVAGILLLGARAAMTRFNGDEPT